MPWNPEASKERLTRIDAPTDQAPTPNAKPPARWSKPTMQPIGNVTVFGRSSLNKRNNGQGTNQTTNQGVEAREASDQVSPQESEENEGS